MQHGDSQVADSQAGTFRLSQKRESQKVPFRQLLIRFGYDGSRFHGVQPQAGVATAGGALEQRVAAACKTDCVRALSFASRTDAGVHAVANWASCRVAVPGGMLPNALADLAADAPDGLRHVSAWVLSERTVARGIAVAKHYRYRIVPGCSQPRAAREVHAWEVVAALDVRAMQRAADALLGTHDFSAYASARATGSAMKTLTELRVEASAEGISIDVRGSGFLRFMVRSIVGHLAWIGAGCEPESAAARRLHSRTLPTVALRAPAGGLCLVDVQLTANIQRAVELAGGSAYNTAPCSLVQP